MAAETVVVPKEHEGIANALRCAYVPRAVDTPKAFRDLLDQID